MRAWVVPGGSEGEEGAIWGSQRAGGVAYSLNCNDGFDTLHNVISTSLRGVQSVLESGGMFDEGGMAEEGES